MRPLNRADAYTVWVLWGLRALEIVLAVAVIAAVIRFGALVGAAVAAGAITVMHVLIRLIGYREPADRGSM